jgi:prepilin-type N-terminal cleavage/methylation domain-containing protein
MTTIGRIRAAGFTLIELMISLAISGIVLMAAYKLLVANQRFYRSQSVIADLQSNIREATLILGGELREISSSGGDIQAMSDTSITINAMRSLGMVCIPGSVTMAFGYVTIQNSSFFSYRTIDNTRDSIFIYREGDPTKGGVDRWLRGKVSSTVSMNCTNGSAGTRVNLTGLTAGLFITNLDSVNVGDPVRTFETVNYRLYAVNGVWWLGLRNYVSGSWTSTQQVAGPLRATDGLKMTYYDCTGTNTVTAVTTAVCSIQIDVKRQSTKTISVPGHPTGVYNDSLSVTVALRNN